MKISRRSFLKYSFLTALSTTFKTAAADEPAVILDFVPFFSQESWEAPSANDCGESCWMMMLLWRENVLGTIPPTVDEISRMWGKPLGEESWANSHMRLNIENMGFAGEYTENATADWYKDQIRAGNPCIALVTYDGFFPENRAANYDVGHYVVVVGFDDEGFYIHDPLWFYESDGKDRHISDREWLYSSQGVGIVITGLLE